MREFVFAWQTQMWLSHNKRLKLSSSNHLISVLSVPPTWSVVITCHLRVRTYFTLQLTDGDTIGHFCVFVLLIISRTYKNGIWRATIFKTCRRFPLPLLLHCVQELQLLCCDGDLAYLTTSHFTDVYQAVCVWMGMRLNHKGFNISILMFFFFMEIDLSL